MGSPDEVFLVLMVFSIPILAIVGGITSGIVKSLGQQKLIELAHRERMAAIERGIPPDKLPPMQLPASLADSGLTFEQAQLRRSHGLVIGGLISAGIGLGMIVLFQSIPEASGEGVWAVGLVPLFVGVACLISAVIVRPKGTS